MTKRMLYYAFKIVQPPPSPVNQSLTTSCQLTAAACTLGFGTKEWLFYQMGFPQKLRSSNAVPFGLFY